MKLFCFPYAGGSASFFDDLSVLLNKQIDVIALEYPGHGKRFKEDNCCCIETMANTLLNEISQTIKVNEEYALFGYSMGTIVLTELLRQLIIDTTIKLPKHVFLCAFAPYLKYNYDVIASLSDEAIKEQIIGFGGVPGKLLENKSFWRMYIPIYRNDFKMLAQYCFKPLSIAKHIPASVLYSESDTKKADVEKWNDLFYEIKEYYLFGGNHFFINQCCKEISEKIVGTLF